MELVAWAPQRSISLMSVQNGHCLLGWCNSVAAGSETRANGANSLLCAFWGRRFERGKGQEAASSPLVASQVLADLPAEGKVFPLS